MPLAESTRNIMVDAAAGAIASASLHSADPGATGANELAGGAYARKAIAFNAAAGGSAGITTQPVFDVPGGSTVAFVGMWSGDAVPVWRGAADVVDEVFAGDGTYTLTSLSIAAAA